MIAFVGYIYGFYSLVAQIGLIWLISVYFLLFFNAFLTFYNLLNVDEDADSILIVNSFSCILYL